MSTVREQSRAAARRRAQTAAIDRVMSAPGADDRQAEATAAIALLGDFRVRVDGFDIEIPLSRLVRHMREHPTGVLAIIRQQVYPC